MKEQNFGTGHGMPAPIPEGAKKFNQAKEAEKSKKQTEEFAENSLPTAKTESVTIHESKQFPFQIVKIITRNENTKREYTRFKIGICGNFVSERQFMRIDTAEKYIASKPWELITNLMCITIKNAIEYEKTSKK